MSKEVNKRTSESGDRWEKVADFLGHQLHGWSFEQSATFRQSDHHSYQIHGEFLIRMESVIARNAQLVEALNKIANLCNSPHWTAERRRRIERIASKALATHKPASDEIGE